METDNTYTPTSESAPDHAAIAADAALESADSMLDRLPGQLEAVTRRGVDAIRNGSTQLRERAEHLSDVTSDHIREEPLKAVLIAAATGAALMALLSLMARSPSPSPR